MSLPLISGPIFGFNTAEHITQAFGVNRSVYHSRFGTPGHQALDIRGTGERLGFGTPVLAAHDGVVEKVSYDVPHKTKGNGIYLLDETGKFSTNYWHLASIEPKIGQRVKRFSVIGTMGNSGWVFPKPSSTCPHCGTHLHFGMKFHGHKNEYDGWVDPLPYLYRKEQKLPFVFNRDLFIGSSGDDVSWLQTVLRIEGYAQDYDPIGYFGVKTARDVSNFQVKYNIKPALGYFGPQTRERVRSIYL